MAKDNVSLLAQQHERALNLDNARNDLNSVLDRLYDVDAVLSVLVARWHEDDVSVEAYNGAQVSAARPIDLALRELAAIREQIGSVSTALEVEADAKMQEAREARDRRLAPRMMVSLDRGRSFLIGDAGDLHLIEPDEEHPGASKLTCAGEVPDDVFTKIERQAKRRSRTKKAA